ncbi:MAG TPA: lysophospholipid acyltransferase family protein [Terriglobales bacterium]|nr:lysophospholipid acyltransferase family protein [Terriglobales bacterium]
MLNKIATTAEAEKGGAELRSAWTGEAPVATSPVPRSPASTKTYARRHGWPSRLRSYFIFDPLIWAYTIVLGSTSLLTSLFDKDGRIQHRLATAWSWLIMKTILSPVTVTGNAGAIVPGAGGRPRVFAITHASALDIPILYVYLPFQFRIVFKSELLSYPFIGWHLKRSGQVCINQQNPSASIGAIKSALRSLRSGMPLVIFPEGGRTPNGKIQPFLPGAFFLAIKAQAEIVPIALAGTFDLLPMNTYHIRSQPLEMRVGKVISTAGMTLAETEAVSARVKAAIEELAGGSSLSG